MSVRCPNGHQSQAEDYCDTCGEPLGSQPSGSGAGGSGGAASSPEPIAAPAKPQTCPTCGSSAPAGALFCENCGFDFTTGTAPTPLTPPSGATLTPAGTPQPVEASAAPSPAAVAAPSSAAVPAPTLAETPAWAIEVWVDPDWYAEQKPEDPMPSVGLPRVVITRSASVLVGRPSRSRGIAPEVDCGEDNGVSRRHCQLSSDGQRWWVEDLGSANGTYLGGVDQPLPSTPLAAAEKRELDEGSRLYLGGWTRLVVRPALPGEA